MILEQITTQAVLETERLTLRPPRRSDVGLLSLYAGDARVAKATASIPHPLPPGASAAFIERALSPERKEDVWIMDGQASGLSEVMGVIGLERMDDSRSEIGYWVAPAFWNTGLASEAVEALLAANPLGVKTVFASVFQTNSGSARVLTKLGFDYIGDAEAFSVAQDKTVPTWTYLKNLQE